MQGGDREMQGISPPDCSLGIDRICRETAVPKATRKKEQESTRHRSRGGLRARLGDFSEQGTTSAKPFGSRKRSSSRNDGWYYKSKLGRASTKKNWKISVLAIEVSIEATIEAAVDTIGDGQVRLPALLLELPALLLHSRRLIGHVAGHLPRSALF